MEFCFMYSVRKAPMLVLSAARDSEGSVDSDEVLYRCWRKQRRRGRRVESRRANEKLVNESCCIPFLSAGVSRPLLLREKQHTIASDLKAVEFCAFKDDRRLYGALFALHSLFSSIDELCSRERGVRPASENRKGESCRAHFSFFVSFLLSFARSRQPWTLSPTRSSPSRPRARSCSRPCPRSRRRLTARPSPRPSLGRWPSRHRESVRSSTDDFLMRRRFFLIFTFELVSSCVR
jgi:hypothetical protein